MAAYDEFERRLGERMAALLRRIDENRLREALERGETFDLPDLTEREWFYREVAWHFWEVRASVQALREIPAYLRYFPKYKTWTKHGITAGRYLRYHVERYLEENYILQLRVKAFLDWLAGRLTGAGQQDDADRVATIKKKFVAVMKQHAKTRGMHVHRERYSDEWLWWIGAAELAGRDDPHLATFADHLCGLVRAVWRRRIRENNTAVELRLDVVFAEIGPLIFPDWGDVRQIT